MAADNNKNDKVRQLYKEDGASKIYPVVIKDSVSDGAGNYGVNAFGTWFRETDMEVKSLSVCEDIKFWEETSTKDSFASVRVKDSSMFINMPLTIGMNNNGYSVKNLTVIAENTSIDSSVLTVKAKKTIVNSSLEITDASINKLTVKDSSFTGESTFNNIVTMKTGLTVYAETDNTAINISTTGNGPHINITGAYDCTGEMNVKTMGINLFGSDVSIYSDASNVNYTPASITKNGYGTFNTLHIGPMDPEKMYLPYLSDDNNWNSDNILKKPSDGSIVFSTTRFGFPGILSEENHIVAIDLNNKIDVLRLNYPTSKTHSSVLMYDASVANNLTVGTKLSVSSDIVINPKYGNIYLRHDGRNKLRVTDSCVLVDASFLCVGLPNSQIRLSANSGGLIRSETNMTISADEGSMNFTLYSTNGEEFCFDYYNGGQHHNKFVIDESNATFTDEVKAKVNGVSDVYLGVPKYFITDWCATPVPAHWKRLVAIGKIRYMGKYNITNRTWYGVSNDSNKPQEGKYTMKYFSSNETDVTLSKKAYGYTEHDIMAANVTHYFALYNSLGNLVDDTEIYCSYIANIYTIIAGFCFNVDNATLYPLIYMENNNKYIDLANLSKLSTYNGPSKIENTGIKIMKFE